MYQTAIDFFDVASLAKLPNPPKNIYFNASRTNVLEGYEPLEGWILQKLDADRSVVLAVLASPARQMKPHIFSSLDAVYHEFEKRDLPFGFVVTK